MAKKGHCQAPFCREPLPPPASTGRPRKYCSLDCKLFAYRTRQREAAQKVRDEALKIESYPDPHVILEHILDNRYSAEELMLILTVVENQFIAERIKRTRTTHGHQVLLGNAELTAVAQQLRRILLRISSHLSRQTPEEVARSNQEAQRRVDRRIEEAREEERLRRWAEQEDW